MAYQEEKINCAMCERIRTNFSLVTENYSERTKLASAMQNKKTCKN